jgi:hypothetical protein
MQNMILYQKLADFSDWLFPVVDNFPKAEKFALCTQIKNSVYELIRKCIIVQKSRDKLKWLFDMDVELEMLRFLVRHAHQRRYLGSKGYHNASRMLAEIGKILGGMFRAFQKGARP